MNDFIDFVKDLEKGKTSGVTPDDLAPEPTETLYDENKDPEMDQIEEQYRIENKRLQESLESDIRSYVASEAKPTYKGFMDSEWSNSKMTPQRFEKDLNYLIRREGVVPGSGSLGTKTGSGEGQYKGGESKVTKKTATPGPYDAEIEENPDEGEMSSELASLEKNYGSAKLAGGADEMFADMQNIVKNIILRRADKRHAIIFGDPGVGKTFEVMEICKRHGKDSPTKAKITYEAGDIGTSMSTLVPFFYKHSQNEIIVLDDNDKMILANLPQDIMNVLKALLDPKAAKEKPVTVRANMLKIFGQRLADLEDEPLKENNGHWFEIDKEALKEGQCVIAVDDEIIVNSPIKLQEAQKLSNMIYDSPKQIRESFDGYASSTDDLLRLTEAGRTNKELLADLVGDDDDDEYAGMSKEDKEEVKRMKDSGSTEIGQEGESFPRKFLFNSSVIFISNLDLDQINTAVLDRAESIEIRLSLSQYLERLGRIFGGLCKGSEFSDVSQELRDWAKKCVYTALGIVIEAKRKNVVIFGSVVEINRKLTFRMFDEFVNAWLRYAFHLAENIDGRDINKKEYRDSISNKLLPEIIRRKIIPWMKQRTKV